MKLSLARIDKNDIVCIARMQWEKKRDKSEAKIFHSVLNKK